MEYPERFSNLSDYAFPRLRKLLDVHEPGGDPIPLTIGEPQHAFPEWVGDVIAESISGFNKYPPNDGSPALLEAISRWIGQRFNVSVDEDCIMALNGTREGLYNAAMALCPETKRGKTPVVLIPNPFYQVYMIAAISVGAERVFVPADAENGFLPDYTSVPADILDRTAIAYICTPSNPQGAVASHEYWRQLIALAEKHDFRIFADECYSEIYREDAPVGALEVAAEMGADPERVTILHSLSKRSNLPGLRSGFVAGGPESIRRIRQLRAYSGAPLPLPIQKVSTRVWSDEAHVIENRALYNEKFKLAETILGDVPGYQTPQGGFFLWLPVEDGETATLKLWQETGVRVLPGGYLSREVNNQNPGKGYIRVAMVAPTQEMQRGLTLIRDCLYD
ncbi:aminotransferase class I/II-fold pyridoxal phosphate-dependent enzyme [Marivivens donghaensis]|uniref:Aminotransferase class I/II-fold pyridoxal phosphate-dependent enzyme n=1 Tax=Marivivens donghaensis TaxID=1699413 RepID=A0ABX0VUU7_9RHOB|nr:aminotransferase class I/II-fold pyridoxal phosphate-dependent enzyme [Marivivens donghaensis]NIY71610.1 aminotransferase class I/II-fold pyridoxal phosphate-dependent enzyme [Marivivens donghaensis]